MAKRVALAVDRVTEHVTDAGGVRAEGRDHAGGQRLAEQVQALEHARAGEVQVHRSLKITLIIEKPLNHGGPTLVDRLVLLDALAHPRALVDAVGLSYAPWRALSAEAHSWPRSMLSLLSGNSRHSQLDTLPARSLAISGSTNR